jgi:hypothetical protein
VADVDVGGAGQRPAQVWGEPGRDGCCGSRRFAREQGDFVPSLKEPGAVLAVGQGQRVGFGKGALPDDRQGFAARSRPAGRGRWQRCRQVGSRRVREPGLRGHEFGSRPGQQSAVGYQAVLAIGVAVLPQRLEQGTGSRAVEGIDGDGTAQVRGGALGVAGAPQGAAQRGLRER